MVVAEDSKATPEQVEFCAMEMEGSRRRFSLSHGLGSVIEVELRRYIEAYASLRENVLELNVTLALLSSWLQIP